MSDVKDTIKTFVTNIIDDNHEGAQAAFHDVLKMKMQKILNPEAAAVVDEPVEDVVVDDEVVDEDDNATE
jgi:hypothetical protein